MRMFFQWASLSLMVLFLVACQTPSKTIQTEDGETWLTNPSVFAQATLKHAQLTQWRYSAKVGVVTPDSSDQANMVWLYDESDVDSKNNIRLYGPLGIGAIRIEFDERGVQLSDKKGVIHQGSNAEQLLRQIVGWSIPVDALQFWLFSLPQPEQTFKYQLDEQKQLKVLSQFGWRIEYSSYRDYIPGHGQLARKVVATKQVTPQQSVKVTLIAKSWK